MNLPSIKIRTLTDVFLVGLLLILAGIIIVAIQTLGFIFGIVRFIFMLPVILLWPDKKKDDEEVSNE